MRNTHEPVNRKARAAQLRKAAEEAYKKGYQCLADVDWEMANFLDPPRDMEDQPN